MKRNYINSTIFLILVYILLFTTLFAQNNTDHINPDNEKYLILFNPSGTETYELGSEVLVEWDYRNIDKIAFQYLSENNVWENIANNIDASKRKYNWIIDSSSPKIFKVRIVDLNDSNYFFATPYYIQVISKSFKSINQLNNKLKKSNNLSQLKIMPLGNSITRGYTDPVPDDFNGYRKKLKLLTEDQGLNFDFVGHRVDGNFDDKQHDGNGGWHANHWAGHPKSLLDSVSIFINANLPDVVLLQIGTNDVGSYYFAANDNTIDTTVSDISKMLDSIYNVGPDIFIILAKIVNREDDPISLTINETATTTAFNNALGIMANSRIANGDKLKLIDMENALLYPDDLCIDGVHPNSIGYDKMAQVWIDAIVDILPKLDVKVYLEGTFFDTDSLNVNLSNNSSFPKVNPFTGAPWNYSGTEKVTIIPNNIVDWVLVSLRSDSLESSTVAQRAAFLRSDGQIVDLDGNSPITFATYEDYYYIVIEHRNHLPIMSNQKVLISP
jgi:lysophospholipase L1-like esterase